MKKIKNIFLIFLSIAFPTFIFYLLLGPFLRVSSVEVYTNKEIQKSNSYKQIEDDLSSFLEKYKGQLPWKVSLKKLVEELNSSYPGLKFHAVRKLPNHLIVFLKKKSTALLLFHKGDFFPVSYTGEIGKKKGIEESFDFPILRGKSFWEKSDRRKKALDILTSIPETGQILSVQNLSEILYNETNDSLLFYLIKGDFILELNEALESEKIKNILFVLNYLHQKKDKRNWIDARPDKKIIVKKAP